MLGGMELPNALPDYTLSPQFGQLTITSPMSIDMSNLGITTTAISPTFSATSMAGQVHSVDSVNTITINNELSLFEPIPIVLAATNK